MQSLPESYQLKTESQILCFTLSVLSFRSNAPRDRDIVLKPVISDFKLSYFFYYLFVCLVLLDFLRYLYNELWANDSQIRGL